MLAPAVEFLVQPGAQGSLCVMRGLLPPGMTVPPHSQDDAEDFLVLTGTHQVLLQGEDGLERAGVHAGDYVHIPAGTPHAHGNTSAGPAVDLIITAARLGQLFADAGPPATDPPQPPAPGDVARFTAVATGTATRWAPRRGTPQSASRCPSSQAASDQAPPSVLSKHLSSGDGRWLWVPETYATGRYS
jgi:quercetin dioxygenase-like cupin family protein